MSAAAPSRHNATPAPLDPVLADVAARWKACGIPDLYEGCLLPHGGPVSRERARNVRAMFYPKPVLPIGQVDALSIDATRYGVQAQIPIQVIWPHESHLNGKPADTLVYFHGGGFVLGDLESHEAHAVRLANEAGCVVVNVDYRLAPEHRFPAAYEDCKAATLWAHEHIDQLGKQARRLAVGGDSAGGNLAAAVALACRDQGIALAAQLLLYPVTDLTKLNGLPEKAYLGEQDVAHAGLDPRASPRLARSHAGLAPAILGVGRHDFLFADNLAYAQVLRDAQVPLTWREFPTLNHGFFSYTGISTACLDAAQLLCADLKGHFSAAAAG